MIVNTGSFRAKYIKIVKIRILMKITIISPGKSKNYLEEETVLEYTSRISRYSKIEWKFISASTMEEEAKSILKALPDNARVIILDEKGKTLDSEEFSGLLQKSLNESLKDLVFVIGGAYGLDQMIKEKAWLSLSLSKLVFPHELVRSILAEQIYRGFTILKGEKYHHS